MGMLPPVSQRAYTTQNQKLFVASGDVREASFANDAAELRKNVPEDQVLDITVTCDGPLARRGFQFLYGIVVVVSWKSEKVLNVEVLSKHCQDCAIHHEMNTSSDEILDWWEGHQASCEVNYCGSSSTMESTLAIWKRSVSKNMLRYTQMISDGDSKTFKLLSDQLPMVRPNLVSKHESVWHVQKIMGMALKEKAKEKFVNERGERVRMRRKGRITDKTIKLLTHYYGKAIRSSTGVCAQCRMLPGRFFTTPSPQHQYCPSGQRSWCKFNWALANSEPSPPNSPTIHPDIVSPLKKVFEQLVHPTLMESCVLGATQNLNESFNSTIWQHCLKTQSSALQPRW